MQQEVNNRIEEMLNGHAVFLFMKGSPQTPMCGFSSNTVKIIRQLIGEDFGWFNVLEDEGIRQGIKEYGQWPTIPQLYVNKELIGGNDIVTEMFNTGELHEMLGLQQPDRTPPVIHISEKALAHIREGLQDVGDHVLYLNIDDEFNTRFSLEQPKGYEIVSEVDGLTIHMDIGTAERANNIEIDWVDELQGSGLTIKNPNEPPEVKQLSVEGLKKWLNTAQDPQPLIFDVRSAQQFEHNGMQQAERLTRDQIQRIEKMDRQTPLVFVCEVGKSSQGAAEYFRKKGFVNVHNLTGGMQAWLSDS